MERTLFHSTNSYDIPNVKIFGVCCRTNLPSNAAFRGFGGPQGMFVMESSIAKVAEKLDMPREEIQAKNLLRENDRFPYGQRAGNCRSLLTWNTSVEEYKLSEIRKRVKDYNKTHFETKKGVAVMPICFGISFTTTYMNQASALVHVYTDGSVSVSTGGVEMVQGLKSNIAGIAAKGFGVREHRIKIESTNTIRVANMSPSAASATTVLNGNATLIAIEQVLDRLKSVVAGELGIQDRGRITIVDEKVLCDGYETDWILYGHIAVSCP